MALFRGGILASLVAAGGALLPATMAEADTIAYWRFEEGSLLADSSGNGHHLTNGGTASAYALPASGAGSGFPDPIPLTGTSNGSALQRTASGSSYAAAAYDPDFAASAFTIEAMLHVTSRTGSGFLAGRWNGSNDSSYAVQLKSTGEVAFILKNADNNTTITVDSGLTLALNTDYYIAVVVDLTGATAAERSATFYVHDLTAGGPLPSPTTKTGIAETGVRVEADTGFSIGAQETGGNATAWAGIVDEVRYSNAALSEDELLIAPEPGTLALLGLGGLFLVRRHARH